MYKIAFMHVSLPVLAILFVLQISSSGCSFKQYEKELHDRESQLRKKIVSDARIQLGRRYRFAGKSPKKGFDCSGFTIYVFGNSGISLNASSRLQAKQGKHKEINRAEPGDLVFFGPRGTIDHVGLVTQNKKGKLFVIHSTNSQGVVEHDVNQILYWKKRIKFARDVISP